MPPLPRPPPSDPKADWPIPQLVLRVDDLSHPGAKLFFKHVDPLEAMREAVISVYCWLYTLENVPRECVPPRLSRPCMLTVAPRDAE